MAKNLQKLELTWIGKGNEPQLEPRILIEDPSKSFGDPKSENILIHGDNLLALKALEQNFTGKIKCIYIDPPFNTGAAFEHYDDGIEHSIWLDLMYRRLKLLHILLCKEGFIAVQLDDNEAAYMKVLLDEIFGRNNYLNQIVIATNKSFGFKSTSSGLFKQANHIFFYCKDKYEMTLNTNKLFIEKEYDAAYNLVFENTESPEEHWTWRNINEVVSNKLGFASSREAKRSISNQDFDFEVAMYALDNAKRVFQCASVTGGAFLKRKETIEFSKTVRDKIIRHPNDDMDYMFIGGRRVIFYSERLVQIDNRMLPGELITDIWSDISIEGIAKEGGVDFPKGKKPEKLISRIIELTTKVGDWVLDSFLGSGTTAAVAHKMNRKWIGVELGEQANTHCLTRLSNVILGTEQSGISKAVDWKKGGGFRFYTLAPSLIKKDKYGSDIINPEYNPNMLAAAMAKQEGFRYSPNENSYWKQGFSSEKDYIFTTTLFITVQILDRLADELKQDESLLICCKSFAKGCISRHKNITIKKIPQMLLGRCEFGKDDYSFNIVNLPKDGNKENINIETNNIDIPEEKPKRQTKKNSDEENQPSLF